LVLFGMQTRTIGPCLAAINGILPRQVRAFSFATGGLVAARELHDQLLSAVLMAPTAFFDATPSGRLLNRFSSDTAAADDSLPFILNIALANAAALVGIIVVLCYAQPLVAVAFLPLMLLYRSGFGVLVWHVERDAASLF
jgi:ATP-binding cassette, subfamily C (CFTR/MRP), member 10